MNLIKTEQSYRAIEKDSSSSLKEFSLDRKKYYKRYILRDNSDDEDTNQATTMGRLVETLLLEPDEFDNRFYMSSCYSSPTGKMLDFVEALYKVTVECLDDNKQVTKDFDTISKEAFKISGFKIGFESVINKFYNSENEIYYREICKVRQNNLSVVTTKDISIAENIVKNLKENQVTSLIINRVSDNKSVEVINQFQIEDYIYKNMHFKSMLDKIIINHTKKEIDIYDLKCTWNVENFYEEYYLYRRAYIQGVLYYYAVKKLTNDGEIYEGYKVNYPHFIVCDSYNYSNPLIFKMNEKSFKDGKRGFSYKNKFYPGVDDIIMDLKFAKENDIWNISRVNYLNNGVINLSEYTNGS